MVVAVLFGVLAPIALTSCAAPAGAGASALEGDAQARLVDEIRTLPGVSGVEVEGGLDGGAGDDATTDDEPRSTTVIVASDADRDDVLDAAERIPEIAMEVGWGDRITLVSASVSSVVDDYSPTRLWSLVLSPMDAEAPPARTAVDGLLAASVIEGVTGLTVVDGWPSASFASLDDIGPGYDALRQLPLFADGGSYRVLSEQPSLRVTEVPGLTSPLLVHELIALALEYPGSEILLEGPEWPKLYIAHVPGEDAAAIQARLSLPALADGSDPGLGTLSFQVTSVGPDGSGYLDGEVGSGV
ncbi:MAG: hypothetical protein ABWY53_00925 [Leifsonia flava]